MAQVDLPTAILQAVSKQDPLLSSDAFPSEASTDIKGALDKIGSRSMITYETIDREETVLEPEAETIVANGSHEARVFEALQKAMDGLTIAELVSQIGDKTVVSVGQGKAFKSKWISKGEDGKLVATVCRYSQVQWLLLTATGKLDCGHDQR
jgi:phenylalanyl-tRNA synthetase alpha chain